MLYLRHVIDICFVFQLEVAMHGKKVMTGLKDDLNKLDGVIKDLSSGLNHSNLKLGVIVTITLQFNQPFYCFRKGRRCTKRYYQSNPKK